MTITAQASGMAWEPPGWNTRWTLGCNVHQAVIHEESPDRREGEVTGVLRKGYMMGDRLLRPAMVKVAKA